MQLQNAVDTHIRLHCRHSTHHNSAVRQHIHRPTNIYYIQPRHNICRPPKNRMSLSHTDRHYISKLYRHSVCYHTTTTTTRKATSEIHLPDTVFDTVFVFRFKVQKGIESSLLSIPFLHSLPKKNITLLHYNITFLRTTDNGQRSGAEAVLWSRRLVVSLSAERKNITTLQRSDTIFSVRKWKKCVTLQSEI